MTLFTMKNAVVSDVIFEANTHRQVDNSSIDSSDVPFPIDQESNTTNDIELDNSGRNEQIGFSVTKTPVINTLGRSEPQREPRYLRKSVSDLGKSSESSIDQGLLTRSRSLSGGEEGRRRSIFGQYWSKRDLLSDHVVSIRHGAPSFVATSRPSSVDVDIRAFSPPEHHRSSIRSHHFSPIDDFFSDASFSSGGSLPPVPTPLRRYCSDGMYPGGVYPLTSPRPILRSSSYEPPRRSDHPVESSVDSLVGGSSSLERKGENVSPSSLMFAKSPPPRYAPWTCTGSPAFRPRNVLHIDMGEMDEAAMNSDRIPPLCHHDSDSSSERQTVKFDPRVTVTEFEEQESREWFSDTELTAFKIEATVLAQRYMRHHPQVAQAFREGRRDPITGMRRQRAMYTNPVFGTNDDSLVSFENSDDLKELVASEVKRILVVDPNKTILMLFCRSLQHIFPSAKIAAAQNGEDALRVIMAGVSRDNGFDIIVVEERLGRRPRTTSVGARDEMLLIDRPSSLLQQKRTSFSDVKGLQKQLGSPEKKNMSGSELLRKISKLQDHIGMASNSTSMNQQVPSDETSHLTRSSPTECWRSLLIGVSVDLESDGAVLSECGADILWGKPPPPMDSILRNELVSALLTKRHRSHLSLSASEKIEP